MLPLSDSTATRDVFHSAASFAWQLFLLTAGLMVFLAAAFVLAAVSVYLRDAGVASRSLAVGLGVITIGLEIIGVIWYLFATVMRGLRFFKEIREIRPREDPR